MILKLNSIQLSNELKMAFIFWFHTNYVNSRHSEQETCVYYLKHGMSRPFFFGISRKWFFYCKSKLRNSYRMDYLYSMHSEVVYTCQFFTHPICASALCIHSLFQTKYASNNTSLAYWTMDFLKKMSIKCFLLLT